MPNKVSQAKDLFELFVREFGAKRTWKDLSTDQKIHWIQVAND